MRVMKLKNIISVIALILLTMSCDPEYAVPTPASSHDPVTGKPIVFPKTNIMVVHASPNAATTLNLMADNVAIASTDMTVSQKFPASNYSNVLQAGSRQIRVLNGGTSVLSTRPLLNGSANNSFYVIGRSGVTLSSRADRLRLIEVIGESLPAVPTGTPNTAHVRFLNFGLLQTAALPNEAASGTSLGSISLQVDATSLNSATGFLLPTVTTFPATAANSRAYASTSVSTFTAFTVPAVGGAGNNYVLDVVNSTTGAVILDNVTINIVAGKVYTLAMIGSNDGAETAYTLLKVAHR